MKTKSKIFDPENHHYFIDDCRVPSVSDAVELLCGEFFNTNPQRTQDGTDIHDVCAADDEGTLIEENVPDEFFYYLRSWRQFKAANPELITPPLKIESPLTSRFGYGGTPDRIFSVRDSLHFRIVEIKTGVKDFDRHKYQLIGYHGLVWEELRKNPKYFMKGDLMKKIGIQAVYINPNGFDIQNYEYSRELWQDFYSAVRVLNRRFNKKLGG